MKRTHAVAIAATTLAMASPSFADVVVKDGRPADVPRREVRFADLDLDTREGLDRLDTRISIAVRIVCGNADLRMLDQFVKVRECRRDSLHRAFADRDAILAARLARRGEPDRLAAITAISIGPGGGR